MPLDARRSSDDCLLGRRASAAEVVTFEDLQRRIPFLGSKFEPASVSQLQAFYDQMSAAERNASSSVGWTRRCSGFGLATNAR